MADTNVGSTEEPQLRRGIHPWMANLIVLGGIVGSCYFVGSGYIIQAMGPSSVFAFMIGGLIIFVVMQSLGELLVNVPRRGSFVAYSAEFLGPLWAVANGWCYWFTWVVYIPSEGVAGGLIMNQIFAGVPIIGQINGFVWAVLFMLLITFINLAHVESFGYVESILALMKIFAVFVFAMVAIGLIFGIFRGHAVGTTILFPTGHAKLSDIFTGGYWPLLTYMAVILVNYQGSEIIGLAASETQNPEVTIPKACVQIVWRIIGIFVIPITCLVFILSHTDSGLNGSMFAAALTNYSVSLHLPFLSWIAAAFAFVVLCAAFSCANCGMYALVRDLYALSVEGLAPKVFNKLNKNGVPQNAAVFSLAVIWVILAFQAFFSQSTFYVVLISVSGFTGAFNWMLICLSQIMFRRRIKKRGYTKKDVRCACPWSPWLPLGIGVILQGVGLLAMPFSGTGPLWWAFFASVICLIIPPSLYAIFMKGRTAIATRLPDEPEFDTLFPDKRNIANNNGTLTV
jgi:AAT family amino acid transporter